MQALAEAVHGDMSVGPPAILSPALSARGALHLLGHWIEAFAAIGPSSCLTESGIKLLRQTCPPIFLRATALAQQGSAEADIWSALLQCMHAFVHIGTDLSSFNCGLMLQALSCAMASTAVDSLQRITGVLAALAKRHPASTTLCAHTFLALLRAVMRRYAWNAR